MGMTSTPLNVAVIGLGNMGRHHARNYFELPGATLVAVCDTHPNSTEEAEKAYGCVGFSNFKDMLSNMPIDAVSIAVSTKAHFDVASYCIEQGVHVLVEKPICTTLEEAETLIALAKQHNVTLMVGHIERFNPAILALEKVIKDGELGDICSMHSRRAGAFPPQIRDANVVIDLAVHDIDVITHLMGAAPDSVHGNGGRALIECREDHAEIFMGFGRRTGFVSVNWITPIRIRTLTATGTKGYAELDYIDRTLTVHDSVYETTTDNTGTSVVNFEASEARSISVDSTQSLAAELSHFLNCIQTKSEPMISGEVGKNALKLALDVLNKL